MLSKSLNRTIRLTRRYQQKTEICQIPFYRFSDSGKGRSLLNKKINEDSQEKQKNEITEVEEVETKPSIFQVHMDESVIARQVEYKKMLEELNNKPELKGLSLREKARVDLEFREKSGQMMDAMFEETKALQAQTVERMENAKNEHDKAIILNEMLESMLYQVNSRIPKEEFKNIDNTPKHLLHMTEEDLKPKSPAVLREELNELIKEARSKIKPVMMDDHIRDQYLITKEEAESNKDIINTEYRQHELLNYENISLEVLRKIQDKKFEINLEYEHTRDLYEKQRVVDQYLEEHHEDNMVLHGYYQNKYQASKMNKYLKFLYNNSYDISVVRLNLFASTFTTSLTTAALFMIHPYLALLTLYDWYLLTAFSQRIVKNTTHNMVLHFDKYHILLNKLNFIGFETEKQIPVQIREIKYMGEVKNTYMSFDYTGMLPSINKLIQFNESYLQKDPVTGDLKSETVPEDDKNTFKHFASFMADNETFLIPLDNDNFKKSVITEELLNHIIHGRQRSVLMYDYSKLEAESEQLDKNMQEVMEMYDDQHNAHNFITTTIAKKRAFQYYHPNRDYGDNLEALQVKRVDNGEFWDNGYR